MLDVAGKTRMPGLPYGEKTMTIMLSRFHLISERYWRTDRRTDLLYQYRASVCWRAINTRNTFRRTLSLSNATFLYFWSRDVHPVQNLLLCTKFHENRIIFRWDMAICRFSKWRPSAIFELFYHHTRPPTKSLAGRSGLSNFMSIWYTDLKI